MDPTSVTFIHDIDYNNYYHDPYMIEIQQFRDDTHYWLSRIPQKKEQHLRIREVANLYKFFNKKIEKFICKVELNDFFHILFEKTFEEIKELSTIALTTKEENVLNAVIYTLPWLTSIIKKVGFI